MGSLEDRSFIQIQHVCRTKVSRTRSFLKQRSAGNTPRKIPPKIEPLFCWLNLLSGMCNVMLTAEISRNSITVCSTAGDRGVSACKSRKPAGRKRGDSPKGSQSSTIFDPRRNYIRPAPPSSPENDFWPKVVYTLTPTLRHEFIRPLFYTPPTPRRVFSGVGVVELFKGCPEGATLYFSFLSALDPLFKASNAPFRTLRAATPGGGWGCIKFGPVFKNRSHRNRSHGNGAIQGRKNSININFLVRISRGHS